MQSRLADYVATHRVFLSRVFAFVFFVTVLMMESRHEGTLVSAVLFMFGLSLVAVATIGRLWCSLYISGYKDSRLITTGPYSMCRNPLYFFSLLGFAGIGFATETVTLGLVLGLAIPLGYPPVIRREERILREKFGEEFEDYRARTPLLIPRLSLFREPGEYAVNPKLFRRTMFDVVWFVWFVGIIEFVEALHTTKVFEPVFYLY